MKVTVKGMKAVFTTETHEISVEISGITALLKRRDPASAFSEGEERHEGDITVSHEAYHFEGNPFELISLVGDLRRLAERLLERINDVTTDIPL